jgi:hypothetical protein
MRVLEDLIASIEKRKQEIAISLAEGHASSMEAYRTLVGQRQGLQMALDSLNDLLEEKDSNER